MDETLNDDTLSERPTLGRTVPEEKEPEGPARTWTDEDAERETLKRPVSPEEMTLAGRYKVLRRLGEGGMGSVWLAEDLKLDGRKVAVKMLPSVLAGKKAAYKQVKQEALMAMKLSHPNIATVRAFEEEDGNPFLVMDYIEGQGLDDILAEKGKLSEEETLRLLTPVAAALDYAHAQGVVHRDVKPGNVIVRKDGTPFVLDFGIAREIQETMTRVTGKFSSGTLLYMSPEQLRGRAPKAAQDVYSFAAVTYECLKGRPPFYRGAVEDQIKSESPEELPEEFGESLRIGVIAGMAKDPEDRPEMCADVLVGRRAKGKSSRNFGHSLPALMRSQSKRHTEGRSNGKIRLTVLVFAVLLTGAMLWWSMIASQQAAKPIQELQAKLTAAQKREADLQRQFTEEDQRKQDEIRQKTESESVLRAQVAELQQKEKESRQAVVEAQSQNELAQERHATYVQQKEATEAILRQQVAEARQQAEEAQKLVEEARQRESEAIQAATTAQQQKEELTKLALAQNGGRVQNYALPTVKIRNLRPLKGTQPSWMGTGTSQARDNEVWWCARSEFETSAAWVGSWEFVWYVYCKQPQKMFRHVTSYNTCILSGRHSVEVCLPPEEFKRYGVPEFVAIVIKADGRVIASETNAPYPPSKWWERFDPIDGVLVKGDDHL